MKSIVLAEKPSVGKELARVLGCNKKNNGFSEGNDYVVSWAMGHLVELADPEAYDEKYKRWSLDTLPILPDTMRHRVIRKTSKQFNTIKKLFSRNDIGSLIIATDAGREGELVARWIMRLGGWKGPFKRLWISSQTDKAIKEGFTNLKEGRSYDNLFRAAECRAEADWIIGLNITRALSCKYDVKLSAGRVQTPTLALIAEREKEIEAFIPKPFWTVEADFGTYSGIWQGKNNQTRIFDQNTAQQIADKVRDTNGVITDMQSREKQIQPPHAYDLTSLQGDANRILGFSAKKTLQLLQRLYEHHKIVTYPRTDSNHITGDMAPTLPDRLSALKETPFSTAAEQIKNKGIRTSKRFVDDAKVSDHHAIIPTEQPVLLSRLDTDERRVWELVASRFLEVLMPPYTYKQITIVTEAAGERFISRGNSVIDLGWKRVSGIYRRGESAAIGTDKEDEEIPEQRLGEHKKHEQHRITSVTVKQGWTKPPSRYSEGTLLNAMEHAGRFIDNKTLKKSIEKGGLGTPATRADIIEKIITNYYVERNGQELVPTPRGRELLELVPEKLKKPELTAQWELRLSEIAAGSESANGFLKDIRNEAKTVVHMVKTSTAEYTPKAAGGSVCPLCGRPLYPARGKRGKHILVCHALSCGYEEEEDRKEGVVKKPSHKEQKIAKSLMRKYGNEGKETATFGELLKASMDRKQKK